jgi:large subunit ribosomal protein L24
MNKLRENDEVIVIAGKQKGKSGKVKKINWKTSKVLLDGVNLVKKTIKPTQENPNGGIVDIEVPVHISNVMVKSPKTGKPTRVSIQNKDGKNIRVAKSCGTPL